ncbi:MAG: YqgE/AlgH family protein [Nitrospirales bacterium]
MKEALGKGIFLVASPALRDPNFRQTVILLCEHGKDGALGVVVNRPTGMLLCEALPRIPILEAQRHVMYAGGPVQTNQVLLLYRLVDEPDDTHHVFDGVYLGGDVQMAERLLTQISDMETFRAYVGYSGWAPGQLENEMKTGSWITIPADPAIVFEQDSTQIWPDVLRSLGKPYALYAEMPPDPQLN